MNIKEFKNGNLHIKLEKDEIASIKSGKTSVIEQIYYNDFNPMGAEYCISNYAVASDWAYNGGYNYYSITSYDWDDLEKGKMVILKPLDTTDLEELYPDYFEV